MPRRPHREVSSSSFEHRSRHFAQVLVLGSIPCIAGTDASILASVVYHAWSLFLMPRPGSWSPFYSEAGPRRRGEADSRGCCGVLCVSG